MNDLLIVFCFVLDVSKKFLCMYLIKHLEGGWVNDGSFNFQSHVVLHLGILIIQGPVVDLCPFSYLSPFSLGDGSALLQYC